MKRRNIIKLGVISGLLGFLGYKDEKPRAEDSSEEQFYQNSRLISWGYVGQIVCERSEDAYFIPRKFSEARNCIGRDKYLEAAQKGTSDLANYLESIVDIKDEIKKLREWENSILITNGHSKYKKEA